MRAAEHAPRGLFQILECPYGLADIVERCVGVRVERVRVIPPQTERELIILPANAPRHGYRFAIQCLGFFVAL